jgi:hypothetical protein
MTGLIVSVPAIMASWKATARMGSVPRPVRALVTCAGAYAIVAAAGWLVSLSAQRFRDDAFSGALIAGAPVVLIAFFVLLFFPRRM